MLQKKNILDTKKPAVPETAKFWNFLGVLVTLSFEPLN